MCGCVGMFAALCRRMWRRKGVRGRVKGHVGVCGRAGVCVGLSGGVGGYVGMFGCL